MKKTPDFMSIATTYLFATGASIYFAGKSITEYESLLGCIFFWKYYNSVFNRIFILF